MKKHAFINLLKTAALFAFVAATMGCSGLADIKNKTGETASIEIQIGSVARYAITPSYEYFDQMANIVFSGKQTDGEATYEKTWNGESIPDATGSGREEWISAYQKLQEDPSVKDIPLGKWEFALECYDKDGALVCSGKTEKTLKRGNNGAITIELENVEGNGSIEIELNISEQKIKDAFVTLDNNYNIATSNYMGEVVNNEGTAASSQDSGYGIKACLKNLDGTVVIESGILPLKIPKASTALAYSVRYEEEEIPAGSYILSFMVYEKKDAATAESLLTTVSELVNVAPGITTNGSLVLTSLNKSYPINYARYVYTYVTDEECTEKGEFDASWLTGNIPLTYTEYDTITLPTAIDVLRPCDEYKSYDIMYYTSYAFDGWYLDEDLIQPIEKIIGSELSGDVTLYAKFERFNMSYYTSAFKGVNDDKGEITVKFSTSAAIPEDWFKQIKFSWKNGGIVSLGNTEPEFEYSYEQGWTTGIFTFKNAQVLEFGSDTFIASIKGVPIAKEEVNTAVLTSDAINAFYPDAENTTEITLPSGGYTSMSGYIFCDDWTKNKYTKLETVNIPEDYTSIGAYAFANCDTITTVNIPDTVTWIGSWAFGGIKDGGCAFESITIPASVESIGNYAFSGCKNLTTVVMEGTPPSLGNSVPDNIYVPYKAINAYEDKCSNNEDGWKISYKNKLKPYLSQTDVKSLGFNNVEYCIVPDSIGMIAENAFEGCTKLKGIVLPYSVAYIADGAFAGTPLETVTLMSERGFEFIKLGTDVFPSTLSAIYVNDYGPNSGGPYGDWSSYQSIFKSSTFGATEVSAYSPFGLKELVVPFGYVSFSTCDSDNSAFVDGNYNELKRIELPASITEINIEANQDHPPFPFDLQCITINATTPPNISEHSFARRGEGSSYIKIIVPEESLEAYKNACATGANWAVWGHANNIYSAEQNPLLDIASDYTSVAVNLNEEFDFTKVVNFVTYKEGPSEEKDRYTVTTDHNEVTLNGTIVKVTGEVAYDYPFVLIQSSPFSCILEFYVVGSKTFTTANANDNHFGIQIGIQTVAGYIIPYGFEEISGEALFKDKSLGQIVIPETVTAIGTKVFSESGITELVMKGAPPAIESDTFEGVTKVAFSAPKEYKEQYEAWIRTNNLGSVFKYTVWND